MADLNNDTAWRRQQRSRREFRECAFDWFVLGTYELFSKDGNQYLVSSPLWTVTASSSTVKTDGSPGLNSRLTTEIILFTSADNYLTREIS